MFDQRRSALYPLKGVCWSSRCRRTIVQHPEAIIESQTDPSPPELQRLAEAGDAEAQYSLGVAYAQGKAVPKDPVAAARWVRKAAEQGHAEAQFHFASITDQGAGVEQDKIEAMKWFLLAAEGGDSAAQNEVGLSHRFGHRGLKRDAAKGYYWLQKSAESSDEVGQFNLANLYYDGGDDTTDYTLAYFLYVLANRAWPDARKEEQEKLRVRLTPGQIQEAEDLIASWRPGTPLPTASKTGKDPILPLSPQEESPTSAADLIPLPENFDMAALDAAIQAEIFSLWPDQQARGQRVQGALLWKERLLQDPWWRPKLIRPPIEAANVLGSFLTSRYNMVFPPD